MRRIHRTTVTTSFPDGHVSWLFGDMYAITMAYAWWKAGMANRKAVFYASFRKLPAAAGYAVAGGIDHLNEFLREASFSEEDLQYLAEQVDDFGTPLFEQGFIEFLRTEKWRCNVWAVREGTLVFPHEGLVRVEGPIWMCELLEGSVLNFLSDQSAKMSRAVRMLVAANWKPISDNSLRRAGGPGGSLATALAVYKAGFAGTSNMLAGKTFGIPSKGTMAHCFPMSFVEEHEGFWLPNEEAAFDAFSLAMPTNTIDLTDTTDTINGLRMAIKSGLRMKSRGHKLKAIRLDSGDLAALGQMARTMLDAAGLHYVKVNATNSLNEVILASIERQDAKIDFYASGDAIAEPGLFGTVYKICMVEDSHGVMRPTVKMSDQTIKLSMPGTHAARRYFDADNRMVADCIYEPELDNLENERWMVQLTATGEMLLPKGGRSEELLVQICREGEIIAEVDSLDTVRSYIRAQIGQIPEGCLRLENPHTYPVGVTTRLAQLRDNLVRASRRKALLAREESLAG
jgi:nicotinate phosphoribosyltransferase